MDNTNKSLSDMLSVFKHDTDIENTKKDLKVFLVAQARHELDRVISLTKLLDGLESRYEEAANKYLEDHPRNAINVLPDMMQTILRSLDRSNEIIKQVLGNEKLFDVLIVDQTKSVSINVEDNLKDPKSRARVRDAIDKIKIMLNTPEEIVEVIKDEDDVESDT